MVQDREVFMPATWELNVLSAFQNASALDLNMNTVLLTFITMKEKPYVFTVSD
jgi:hypothetical protein